MVAFALDLCLNVNRKNGCGTVMVSSVFAHFFYQSIINGSQKSELLTTVMW